MEATSVNKREAMNHIRRFGNRFDRFRNAGGAGGSGGRNASKRPKAAPNPASRKSNVFNEQVRYAWHGAVQDLKSTPLATFLTVMVIAISLTLPSVCYMVYKNVSTAASQYYPTPQITVYLEKTLDDDAAARVVGQLQAEQGVEKVNYLSRDEALGEFRNWSGFGGALDMLEENPLPAVAVVIPKLDFQGPESLNTLREWKAAQIALCGDLGWQVLPGSLANFFTARLPVSAGNMAALLQHMRARGVKLRECTSFGLPGHVRLGVLPPVSQEALRKAWRAATPASPG